MNRIFFYVAILVLLFNQCKRQVTTNDKLKVESKKQFEERMKLNYYNDFMRNLSFFPNELTDFIPKPKNKDEFIRYSYDIPRDGKICDVQYEFWLESYLKLNPIEIDSILNSKKFIKSYLASDTTPLLIFSYFDDPYFNIQEISFENPKRIANQNKQKSKEYPIPANDLYGNKTFTGLHKSFTINILDAKPGIYTDTSKLQIHKYLPSNWQHGYSRGISISRELGEGIFWIVAW